MINGVIEMNTDMICSDEKTEDKKFEDEKFEDIKFEDKIFEVCPKEILFAFLFVPLSYIYVSALDETDYVSKILLGIFTVLFVCFVEIMFKERRRSEESYFFLACILIITIAYCFGIGKVWDEGQKSLFLHLFAIYWVVVRSNSLCEGETSHMFAWDGLMGICIMPFGNYLLGVRTIGHSLMDSKKRSAKKVAFSAFAVFVGFILFIIAMSFLRDSDENYAAMLDFIKIDIDGYVIFKIILSLLVAAFLYGMVGGMFRSTPEIFAKNGDGVKKIIAKLNKIAPAVWVGFIVLFSIFYVLFFALQGSYMIDAFAMKLPQQYTFSQYAVKGFGDMCAVMVINFILLWLTMRTSETKSRITKTSGAVLMSESLVFALIAFLKLLMYIRAYGFTPLRLQSTWLVVVLSFACVCILFSMFVGKKTARIWFIGSAATLALLTLF